MGCGTGRLIDLLYMQPSPPPQPVETRRDSPVDILKTRLARGEITLEQFEQMRCTLVGIPPRKAVSHIRKP